MPGSPLPRLLADELDALRAFVALLEQEQESLVAGQVDALLGLIEQKSVLATRLGDCSTRREAALGQMGLPAGRAGMEAWLASAPPAAESRQQWNELLPLAATARELNELNGKLIGTRLQHNQQALTALLGAAEQAMTYGPDGHTQLGGGGSGGGRSRGSA